MNMVTLDYELPLRLGFFGAVFLLMALWELAMPRRALLFSKGKRWLNNVSITTLNSIALRLLLPLQAVGVALFAEKQGWGLFHMLSLPPWLGFILAVIFLDFIIYAQHRLFHQHALLWRLHMVHHTDLDIDVTTGARFHPLEIILSMLIKMTVVLLIGAPALAVVAFDVLLNATSMFNHSNARMPLALDAMIRKIIVTPDMHRVHHSVLPRETNSNYGFNLSVWDRWFGSYRAQPEAGHTDMVIGLPGFREEPQVVFSRMLMMPFRKKK